MPDSKGAFLPPFVAPEDCDQDPCWLCCACWDCGVIRTAGGPDEDDVTAPTGDSDG